MVIKKANPVTRPSTAKPRPLFAEKRHHSQSHDITEAHNSSQGLKEAKCSARCWASYIIGIDEVGRGPLAGPVTVAAVALPCKFKIINPKPKIKLKDSKKLTAQQREEWAQFIKNSYRSSVIGHRIFYASASCYPKTIDRINITQAANLAATRALNKLCKMLDARSKIKILLDGGLYLNYSTSHIPPQTIIRGDEKFNCIKLASIVAKVKRDRVMKRLHKKFPIYGFDEHMGYGTKKHITAIKKHGISEAHRLSFVQNFINK